MLGEYVYVVMAFALAVFLVAQVWNLFLKRFFYPAKGYSEKRQRKLLIKTLKKLGCKYDIGEGEVRVIYAENQFVLQLKEQLLWIYLTYWGKCDLSTMPPYEVTRLKEAINLANQESAMHIVYSIEEGNTLYCHSQLAVYFADVIPDIAHYLQTILDALLQSPHLINEKMDEFNEQQTRERVKVKGFSVATEDDNADESAISSVEG